MGFETPVRQLIIEAEAGRDAVLQEQAGSRGRLRASLKAMSFEAGVAALTPSPQAASPQAPQAEPTPKAELKNDGTNQPHDDARMHRVYHQHRMRLDGLEEDPRYDAALGAFEAHFNKHQARYEKVAAQVDLPAELIAALHWRESTGDFSTYLHQGDPLGKPAVHVPSDIPVFHVWEDAAVHALKSKGYIQREMGMTEESTDVAAMATYAEYYNGLGYTQRNKPSPYVYAGTDEYRKGKFVADGKYSSSARDRQPGVVGMLGRVANVDTKDSSKLPAASPLLKQGAEGTPVEELQRLLGIPEDKIDGIFGPGTKKAVVNFQKSRGLGPDGAVGEGTWTHLRQAAGEN